MTLVERLTVMFLKKLMQRPEGRAHFLAQVADAENNDEGQVFAALKERAKSDPELHRLVARHAADEERHAELLNARALATGVPRPQVPDSLKILHRLDEALGGFFRQPIQSDEDVMRMYLLLQVIEERAVTQFPMFKVALAPVDPESARVFEQIEADEERHLKYCQAIARRYAPSEAVHEQTLQHFRKVEWKVFAQNSNRNLKHVLDHGLVPLTLLERAAWRVVSSISTVLDPSRPTAFTQSVRQQQVLAAAL
ncbi:MAG: ferritin-like domain-containing protein [Archangiaceae bacterium]|nr:ferritin-like domain-containing protein [Archangiaceae bacterium]